MLGDDGKEKADERGVNYVLLHVGYTVEPDEVKAPKSLDESVGPAHNTEKGGGYLRQSGQLRRTE